MIDDDKPIIDPAALDDKVRKIYEVEGYSFALDLSRVRKDMGLTFSQEALSEYCNAVSAFVSTRVMRYWNEHKEPPIKMSTLVTVSLDHARPAEHPEDAGPIDPVEEALHLAERVITAHEQVEMDTPEDKALHARACEAFRENLAAIRLHL